MSATTYNRLGGILRELIAAVGGALVAFGVTSEVIASSIIGVALAALSLYLAIESKESGPKLGTTIRKLLSTVGGAVVVLGIANPDQVEALLGLAGPLVALVSSYIANGQMHTASPPFPEEDLDEDVE